MSVEDWEREKAEGQRGTLLAMGGLAFVVFLGAGLWFGGVFEPSPDDVVSGFLDAVISEDTTVDYVKDSEVRMEVTTKVVRGYEIKNVSGDVVSATVIFESRAGTDLPKTLRFTVQDGTIVEIE